MMRKNWMMTCAVLLMVIGVPLQVRAQEAPAAAPDAKPATPANPQPAAEKPRHAATGADTMVTMNFDKADIVAVLRMIGQAAGVTLVIDPSLDGDVTITSTGPIPLSEAFEVLSAALKVRGFVLVGQLGDRVMRVIPEKKAVVGGMEVNIGDHPTIGTGDQYVTQIIPILHIDAAKLKTDLDPLVSKDGASIIGSASTNTLIVTDSRANVARIANIVKELDQDTSAAVQVEVILLQHASATALKTVLDDLFKETPEAAAARTGGRPPQPPGAPGQPGQPQPPERGLAAMKEEVHIEADERTNSLIVSASKERIDMIKQIVAKLDNNIEPDIQVKVFKLEHGDVTEVAQELNQILEQPQGSPTSSNQGGFGFRFSRRSLFSSSTPTTTRTPGIAGLKENQVIADVRTNSLIVTGTEENLKAMGELINQIDADSPLSNIVKVFPLQNAKASDIATTLQRVFRGQQQTPGFFSFLFGSQNKTGGPLDILKDISVQADVPTNSVVVTAPPQAFTAVEQLVQQLDQPQPQVYIEAIITDVTLDATKKLGVEWSWNYGRKAPQTLETDFGLSTNALGQQQAPPGLRYSILGSDFKSLLNTLVQNNNVHVISTPQISTTNNVAGNIQIGQQFPYVEQIATTAAGQVIPQFGFKDISVQLTVTPHVQGDKSITMDIQQTINELNGTVQQGGFTQPIVGTREAKTSVSVSDGQTVVIGGMMRQNETDNIQKIPILGDLPLLGSLFRSSSKQKTNSELMVFLTPHIIHNSEEARALTEAARQHLNSPIELPKQGPIQSSTAPAPAPTAQPAPTPPAAGK